MAGKVKVRNRIRAAGLMSGTSADGVDAAIVDIAGDVFDMVCFDTFPYPADLRREVLRLAEGQAKTGDICHMNFVLGEFFAQCLVKLASRHKVPLDSIDLIGSHGQTVWHEPAGRSWGGKAVRSTLQIAEPSVIAQRTGITTVADFRPADIAAGGQGAPLVPFADLLLLGDSRRARAIQNIGGIANVTYLPPLDKKPASAGLAGKFARASKAAGKVIAFDTGPGNMIIDRLTWQITRGRQNFDRDGRIAGKGKVNQSLLASLMRHEYLKRKPPKTTGREMFGRRFSDSFYKRAVKAGASKVDVIATATAFTACSIAQAYRRFLPPVDEVIICGGGARNPTLLAMLQDQLKPARVMVMDKLGINGDAKEAISFALLACATILNQPCNVPAATGAKKIAILGKIIPGRLGIRGSQR